MKAMRWQATPIISEIPISFAEPYLEMDSLKDLQILEESSIQLQKIKTEEMKIKGNTDKKILNV